MRNAFRPLGILALACGLFPATLQAEAVRDALLQLEPDITIVSTSDAPLPGLKQVVTDRGMIYATPDGRYVIVGELLDLHTQRNVGNETLRQNFGALAAALPGRIRFGPDDAQETLYVFTDTTCGYCVKLHEEMPALNARGVAVEYLAWPRRGLESDAYRTMRGIWCADDPAAAYERVIAGRRGRSGSCEDPIAAHLALGQVMGVQGTPAVYTADGQRLGGYRDAASLLEALGL